MKTTLLVILLAAAFTIACGEDAKSSNTALKTTPTSAPTVAPTALPTVVTPKDGDFPGRGKVTKINNELGSVELNHEEIVGVMPAMIMEFYVSDKAMLKGLAVGDQVDFVLRQKDRTDTIIKIKKAR